MSLRPPGREDWQLALGHSLEEALPRLFDEEPQPLLRELLSLLGTALAEGRLELPLTGPAPAGVHAAGWPMRHRQVLLDSRLSREPDGPLVLTDGVVAWRRWHQQGEQVLQELLQRSLRPPGWAEQLPQLGGGEPPEPAPLAPLDPQQRRAVSALRHHGLLLLEGGPGTGKTSTVRRLLDRVRALRPETRMQLAAPTGKAAARLRSVCGGGVPCATLHRLLESRGERFGRHRQRPLELDLLVVDEVSMLDQGLMAALLEALPAPCQLVLVGDGAQLPPIAPGSVLQQLQSPSIRAQLGGAAVTLSTTYRNAGAIASVAAALRAALPDGSPTAGPPTDASETLTRLRPMLEQLAPGDNLRWHEADPSTLPALLLERLRQHQQQLAELAQRWQGDHGEPQQTAALEAQLLAALERLLVLTPRRQGRWGLESLHQALLGAAAARPPREWPSGTPVLCCRNLPELGLANGDLGVLVGNEGERSSRRLLFAGQDGSGAVLRIHPAQLAGATEPALALTVHKAQGSEAQEVVVLLPAAEPRDPRLLYTGLTRARERALLITARPIEPAAAGL